MALVPRQFFDVPAPNSISGAGLIATVQIIGLNDIVTALRAISARATNVMGAAMRAEMERIIQDAEDNYVPVDTGKLVKSAKVAGPFRSGIGGDVWVEGSFGGGVLNSRGQPYALIVHEIPDPPHFHPHGSWKYLQIPFMNAASSGMVDRIRADVIARLTARGISPVGI